MITDIYIYRVSKYFITIYSHTIGNLFYLHSKLQREPCIAVKSVCHLGNFASDMLTKCNTRLQPDTGYHSCNTTSQLASCIHCLLSQLISVYE